MKVDISPRLGKPGDPNFERALLEYLQRMAQAINLAHVSDGTTAERPVGADLTPGRRHIDTTLGYTVEYNGTAWVDAAGTGV